MTLSFAPETWFSSEHKEGSENYFLYLQIQCWIHKGNSSYVTQEWQFLLLVKRCFLNNVVILHTMGLWGGENEGEHQHLENFSKTTFLSNSWTSKILWMFYFVEENKTGFRAYLVIALCKEMCICDLIVFSWYPQR